jgi:hypothetical protein
VSSAPFVYQRRSPGDTILYRIVRDRFERFRAQAAGLRDGEGPTQFVEQAFRDFLRCGRLAAQGNHVRSVRERRAIALAESDREG